MGKPRLLILDPLSPYSDIIYDYYWDTRPIAQKPIAQKPRSNGRVIRGALVSRRPHVFDVPMLEKLINLLVQIASTYLVGLTTLLVLPRKRLTVLVRKCCCFGSVSNYR